MIEYSGQRLHDIVSLLSHGRDVASNAAERLGPLLTAESPGYFLFYLHHTDVAFGLIVIKRDLKVPHKPQYGRFVAMQVQQQITHFALFNGAALRTRFTFWGRMIAQAPGHQLTVKMQEAVTHADTRDAVERWLYTARPHA